MRSFPRRCAPSDSSLRCVVHAHDHHPPVDHWLIIQLQATRAPLAVNQRSRTHIRWSTHPDTAPTGSEQGERKTRGETVTIPKMSEKSWRSHAEQSRPSTAAASPPPSPADEPVRDSQVRGSWLTFIRRPEH